MPLDEKTRVAWVRFTNGLKLDGRERALIAKMVCELKERVRKAEQAQWNAEHYLEIAARAARHEMLMGRDHDE